MIKNIKIRVLPQVWRDAEHNSDSNWKDDVGEEYSVTVGPGKQINVNFDRSTGFVEDL